jgi:hypothetical protein
MRLPRANDTDVGSACLVSRGACVCVCSSPLSLTTRASRAPRGQKKKAVALCKALTHELHPPPPGQSKASKTSAKREWYIWRKGKVSETGEKLPPSELHPSPPPHAPLSLSLLAASQDPLADAHGCSLSRIGDNWTAFFTGPAWTYDSASDEWYLSIFSPCQFFSPAPLALPWPPSYRSLNATLLCSRSPDQPGTFLSLRPPPPPPPPPGRLTSGES